MDSSHDEDRVGNFYRCDQKVSRAFLVADDGSIAPLALGLAALSLATILVTTCATSLYTLERRLTTLAEFAALSGAEHETSASEFLEQAGPVGFIDLGVQSDVLDDGLTTEVVLCSTWIAPLPSLIPLPQRRVCGKGAARAG
jgi:hypothetical protein